MVEYNLIYDDEKRFTHQRSKLNPAQVKKLKRCIKMILLNGPQVKFADNHLLNIDGEQFRSMDLSKGYRLTYQCCNDTIILFDCGNHLIRGKKYITTKSII